MRAAAETANSIWRCCMTQKIALRNMPEAMRGMEREIAKLILRVIHDEAYKSQGMIIPQMIASAKPYQPTDQGIYAASHEVWKDEAGATIGSTVPYAPVIEYGRRPGQRMPPEQPIQEWVKRKLAKKINQRWRKQRKKKRGGKRTSKAEWMAKAIQRTTSAVRWKIHLKGTKPRHIYTRAHPLMKKSLGASLRRMKRSM